MTAFLLSGHWTYKTRRQGKLAPFVLISAQAPQVLGRHLLRGTNYGQRSRIANLLVHPHLDWDDINPGARADALLYLRDREGLLSVRRCLRERPASVLSLP